MDRSKSEKSMFSTAAATSGPASRVCRVPDWVSWSTSKLWNIHHESRSFMIICYGFSMNFRLFFLCLLEGSCLAPTLWCNWRSRLVTISVLSVWGFVSLLLSGSVSSVFFSAFSPFRTIFSIFLGESRRTIFLWKFLVFLGTPRLSA